MTVDTNFKLKFMIHYREPDNYVAFRKYRVSGVNIWW